MALLVVKPLLVGAVYATVTTSPCETELLRESTTAEPLTATAVMVLVLPPAVTVKSLAEAAVVERISSNVRMTWLPRMSVAALIRLGAAVSVTPTMFVTVVVVSCAASLPATS